MDISPRTTTATGLSDKSWIYGGMDGGLQNMLSETLDLSLFDAETHYPDGSILSGTVLARVTATGLLGPYDDEADDGLEDAVGHLFEDERVFNAAGKAGVAVFHDGVVVTANLPDSSGIDDAAKADLKNITYRD